MTATGMGANAYFINNVYTTEELSSSIAYSLTVAGNDVVTLSANTAALGASFVTAVQGLLYVPTLSDNAACTNATALYVPTNVTTESDLPGTVLPRMAIAPWTSVDCVQAYLAMGRADIAQSFVFFLPDQGDAVPPAASNASWSLGDGGQWKSDNGYPVYAVSSTVGEALVKELSLYSGNITTIPNAQTVIDQFGDRGSVRLALTVDINSTSNLPSLWIFLVIILAILICLVGIISGIMHLIQRRRRANLRRRIANGEVDLEALGIKRLKVPKELMDKMPCYTYEEAVPVTAVPIKKPDTPVTTWTPAKRGTSTSSKIVTTGNNHFEQPACAICLDDFVAGETQVRELPCDHIFHPECVDTFLTQNSSLCPLCKKSAMPAGWCPSQITAAMVRKERLLRRARRRANRLGTSDLNAGLESHGLANLMARRHARGEPTNPRNTVPAISTSAVAPPAAEIQNETANETENQHQPNAATLPEQSSERREWIRRRIDALAGETAPVQQDADEDEPRRSYVSRAFRTVFPRA